MVTFRKEQVIEACAAKDMGRYAFNGVLIDPAKGRMVATDGRKLVVVPCEVDTEERGHAPVVVPLEAIKAARKAGKRLPPQLGINGKVSYRVGDGMAECAPMEGEFPDVDAILPRAKAREGSRMLSLNARFLMELSQALGDAGDGVTLEIPAEIGKPILVWAQDATRKAGAELGPSFGVLMPITGK